MEPRLMEWRAFLLLLLVIGALTVMVFLPYLNMIILAGALTVLFEPIYQKLKKGTPNRPGIAALLTVLLVVIIVIAPLVFFGSRVIGEAGNLYSQVTTYVNHAGGSASALQDIRSRLPSSLASFVPADASSLNDVTHTVLGWFLSRLGNIFSTITSIIVSFVLMLITIYYMLKDGPKFVERLLAVSPLAKGYDQVIGEKIYATVNSVIKGTLLIAVIQGIVAGIGFLIFGVPNAALLGGATVFASLVPAVGTMLVTIPVVVYLLATGHVVAGIGIAAWGILIVAFIDNFIRPYILRRGVKIHPVLILLSVLGGLHFFGPIGFLAGPLVLSLFLALLDIYTTYARRDVEAVA